MFLSRIAQYYKYRSEVWRIADIAKAHCSAGDLPIPADIQCALDIIAELDKSGVDWRQERTKWFEDKLLEMQTVRVVNKAHSLQRLPVSDDPHGFRSRCYDTFWDVLKRKGVRWLIDEPKHGCPVCEDGPRYEQVQICRIQGRFHPPLLGQRDPDQDKPD